MSGRRKDPGWRDRAAAELLLRHLPGMELGSPVLVMGDPLGEVASALGARGLEVEGWNRRALGGGAASPWPPPAPFSAVALRLPRSKGELAMTLAGAAGALSPGGLLLVYGAKDEGAGSADGPMEEFFEEVGTAGVGGHCRLLMGKRREKLPPFRDTLPAWRELHSLDVPGLPDSWVSYPGVFARGRLDPGTRLLLGALQEMEPDMEKGLEILDYGCGSGVVGAFALVKLPGVRIHLLDVDAVALEAARENVPQGSFLLRDGLPTGEGVTYDAILTNPPFHRGKAEDPEMIRALIGESPAVLSPRGRLVLVAQKRLYLEDAFRGAFREVSHLAEGDGFRVWEGRIPS